ncbi:hypothetical protein G7Y89_g55 [Cudoniella acicularis]|uniref:Heterokaryon incompatibility domain-containing protein n=1 Tax=Cudoniella acicularis TaxID=354080 RepID=A0A8H4RZX3_9HELO|nr:hypothetical protein G7Y89_g55 [Cudoniella acicularis]
MNRLFGAKSTAPKPSLNSAIKNVDERVETIDVKLAAINAELQGYQAKLSKMRDGPGKTAIKQKALKVLQRRKMYEGQRDQLQQQSWNMEQAGMMQDNLKNVMTTVDAMKQTNKSLKQQYGKINIDKIERMQDEMADLMDIGNDIQESISRSYDIPEDVDEAELDAELEALGEEVEFENMGAESTPSFMVDEVPQFIDEPPQTTDQTIEASWGAWNRVFFGGPPAINLELFSESTESSPFKTLGVSREIFAKPSPDDCVDTFNAWMIQCRDRHSGCPNLGEGILPKRVIDLKGNTQGDSVALLETAEGQKGCYITVSHCWGTESFIQTTRATLQQRKTCIGWSELPRTFQDAVILAQKMELQYIWIDSLYIIQDDKKDWQTESAVMVDIYSNSYITFAATGQESTKSRTTNRRPSQTRWHLQTIRRLDEHPRSRRPPPHLLSRAWVFQERFLSPRVLHFHSSCLVWECSSAQYIEPYDFKDVSIESAGSGLYARLCLKKLFAALDSSGTTPAAIAYDLWLRFAADYSKLRLPYEADRLPALSGIATRFQRFFSITGRGDVYITFRHVGTYYNEDEEQVTNFVPNFVADPRLNVLDVSCSVVGKNRFGYCTGGKLDIAGCVVDAIVSYKQFSGGDSLHFVLLSQTETDDDWVRIESHFVWQDVPLDHVPQDFDVNEFPEEKMKDDDNDGGIVEDDEWIEKVL